jgi:transcriptional regulator with PAS, ATPase and Fis domain
VRCQKGHFRAAGWGTILLDEVSEIPPNIQAKFLRAIEDRTFFPLGSSEPHPVACCIIGSTNASLPESLSEGSFRRDLYYRLAEIHLQIPPLRERPGEVPS